MAQHVSIPNGNPEAHNDVVSVEGLESFFDLDELPQNDTGLTMKQAVHFYGVTPKLIRERIKNGEIPAVRMEVGGKKKWRVYPAGVPESFLNSLAYKGPCFDPTSQSNPFQSNQAPAVDPAAFLDEDPDFLPEWTEEVLPEQIQVVTESYLDMAQANRELLDRVKELESRLEAAAYRNGYLESQLESTQEKLRCLTLRNQETRWWSGLARIFRV
jgi:hypothetical protein